MTQPMITSSTSSGFMPERFTASRTTIAPSSVALNPFSVPRNFPTGVRTAPMITGCLIDDMSNSIHEDNLGLLLISTLSRIQLCRRSDAELTSDRLITDCGQLDKSFRVVADAAS